MDIREMNNLVKTIFGETAKVKMIQATPNAEDYILFDETETPVVHFIINPNSGRCFSVDALSQTFFSNTWNCKDWCEFLKRVEGK